MTMNQLKAARPLTDWLFTKDGFRYRWIALDKKVTLQELAPDRSANTVLSVYKWDT